MKKYFTLFFTLFYLASLTSVKAQKTFYILNVNQAGTLEQQLSMEQFKSAKSLVIKGQLNGTDISFLHYLLASEYKKKPKSAINRLNLKDVRIVPGGDAYYTFTDDDKITHTYYTQKDTIGPYMFNAFRYLSSLVLPDSTYYIGKSACFNNALITIDIPKSCTTIDDAAFQWCDKLTSIRFMGLHLKRIGRLSFYNCIKLEQVMLPNSLETMDDGAFAFCSSLKNIRLSNRLTEIDSMAFYNCKALKNITIPQNIKILRSRSFEYANPKTIRIEGENLESLEDRVFYGCQELSNITLPKSVYNIMSGSFAGCFALEKGIPITQDNPYFCTIDGSLFSKDSLLMYQLKADPNLEDYTVPPTVKEIMPYGIAYSGYLLTVRIPKTVEMIDEKGLYFLINLKNIYAEAPTPTDCSSEEAFDGDLYENINLTVPESAIELYKNDNVWGKFSNIKGAKDVLGVRPITNTNAQDNVEIARYNLQGQRLTTPTKGWQIIRYRNGSAKKVYIQ